MEKIRKFHFLTLNNVFFMHLSKLMAKNLYSKYRDIHSKVKFTRNGNRGTCTSFFSQYHTNIIACFTTLSQCSAPNCAPCKVSRLICHSSGSPDVHYTHLYIFAPFSCPRFHYNVMRSSLFHVSFVFL